MNSIRTRLPILKASQGQRTFQKTSTRSLKNAWGTYGYNNFGHDTREKLPWYSTLFYGSMFVGTLWAFVHPMLTYKVEGMIYKFRGCIGYPVSSETLEAYQQKVGKQDTTYMEYLQAHNPFSVTFEQEPAEESKSDQDKN